MNLLITNCIIFTNDEKNSILKGHAVAIAGTAISEIGPEQDLIQKYASYKIVDAAGRLLMPGLVNAHMHSYSTFARGLALQQAPQNFHEILQFLWWRLDSALDEKSVYYSAAVPAISAVKHGVTTIIDHHASPNAIDGSLDQIEEAMSLLGLRATLCYEVSDRDGPESCKNGLRENERYIRKCAGMRKSNEDHLYSAMLGLHASFTLADETLAHASEIARVNDRGCHIHVLEDSVDDQLTREEFGSGVVQRLAAQEILGPKTIAAHAIHVTAPEIDLLAETDTIVAHNPQSNMNNAVGRADIFELIARDILVGIGTDGMSADLWPDIRTANLLHKHHTGDSNVGWNEIQAMTLKNNPRIYERVSGQKVGRIAAGHAADVILVDYFPPTPLTRENIWGHFLFGVADAPVDTTIINGRIVMQNKEIAGLDEESIAAHATECAESVWQRFSS